MKVTTDYISCGSNCQPHAVDWCPNNNIICYASSNSVIIYDPDYLETGRVVQTLLKHQSQVKIVEWISNNVNKSSEILSASLDGTIIIWSQSISKISKTYEPTSILTLNDNLSTAHAAYCPKSTSNTNESSSDSLLIAGSSFKDIFKIWYRESGSIVEQNLDLNKKIPNEIKITHLPGDSSIPAIIMCLDDATIDIYTWNIYTDMKFSELNFNHTIKLRGHQDWIQCLDIVDYNRQSALMATGSQDGTIRLWKISSIDPEAIDQEQRYQFSINNNNNFDISLESVLNGHDHWVYGVHWSPKTNNSNSKPLQLLSSGLDKTIIIWEQSPSGVWIETVKLGKVGGNSIGFYGCKFNGEASSVLAQGYQGTFHLWKYNKNVKKWRPRPGPSGHFGQVTDLHWEPDGKYLLTTSLDQTTRIHVPWTIKLSSVSSPNWHEIARPQIHGYDINCITILNSTMFCSGADEKVIRIFKAPTSFIDAFNSDDWSKALKVTDSASVPALGLTNKTTDDKQQYLDAIDDHDNIKRPPTEEEIIRYTLWPELEKLYGHGYELFAIAGRNDGKLIATACKSTSPEYSAIILWSTETWAQIDKLMSHRLTVTQLEFSPDGKYLLSVSRDRRWSLFYTDSGDNYKLIASSAAKSLHSRIIWCCSWSHDSKYFATGSRDGKIGLWSVDQLKENPNSMPAGSIELPDDSVTALNFLNKFIDNSYILAVGFDDGTIEIRKIINDKINIDWICCKKLDNQQAHHKTVKRLSFRPTLKDNYIELASCSADRAVKIYTFYIYDNDYDCN